MEYTQYLEMFTTRERLGIDAVKLSYLEWASQEDRERQEKYKQYRNYYDGEQRVMITDRQKEFLELEEGQEFSANMCPLVVDELERRMTVAGFDAPGDLGGHDGVLWKWWRRDRMDSKQSDTHLSAIRDGDTYVIVSWNQDEKRPEFNPNLAYDGSEGVKVHYSDETGKIEMASKRWVVKGMAEDGIGERRRMNLYFADRVERYISDDKHTGGDWAPFTLDGNDAIIVWTDSAGNPLGVPVFHLKYKSGGYRWGKSILEDVIPIQNALNKSFIDVIAAADTTAFRIYFATGTDMIDEDGNPITLAPGTMLVSDSPDATFGFMPGENLRPLIEVLDMCKVTIAQVSETPMHLFQVSGQNASEGAQKQQEVGMINKAEKWGIRVGNFWEDCMSMAILLGNAFDGDSLKTDEIIETIWADMEVRDKQARRKAVAETAKTWADAGADLESAAKQAGVPAKEAEELGALAIPVDIMPMGEPDATQPDSA